MKNLMTLTETELRAFFQNKTEYALEVYSPLFGRLCAVQCENIDEAVEFVVKRQKEGLMTAIYSI